MMYSRHVAMSDHFVTLPTHVLCPSVNMAPPPPPPLGPSEVSTTVRASSFDLEALVRPNIWALQPYRCARDDYHEGVLLDANENAYGPCVPSAAPSAALERYPEPLYLGVKERIGEFRQVAAENIFLGVGSDEAIDMTVRIFCRPGRDSVLVCPPTYPMYKVAAATNDVGVVTVPLRPDLTLDVDAVVATAGAHPEARVIFVCSPNNPTGNDVPHADVAALLARCPDRIVVVDEAYVDFSRQGSVASWVRTHPNLVVLQTLSKSFGLAGIRLGMAFADAATIAVYNRVKAPYSINKLTAAVALDAFAPSGLGTMQAHVAKLQAEREWLRAEIERVPGVERTWPSEANFFLVRLPNALAVYKAMAEAGVVVRYRGTETHLANVLRITVGTRPENETLLRTLRTCTPACNP
jgi:histidinol-phosphate aminotransferase